MKLKGNWAQPAFNSQRVSSDRHRYDSLHQYKYMQEYMRNMQKYGQLLGRVRDRKVMHISKIITIMELPSCRSLSIPQKRK